MYMRACTMGLAATTAKDDQVQMSMKPMHVPQPTEYSRTNWDRPLELGLRRNDRGCQHRKASWFPNSYRRHVSNGILFCPDTLFRE